MLRAVVKTCGTSYSYSIQSRAKEARTQNLWLDVHRDGVLSRNTEIWFPVRLTRCARLRRSMNQGAGAGVFQNPKRAIGTFFYIAKTFA